MNYFTILTSFLSICVGTSSDLSRFREKRTASGNRSDLRGTKHALVSVGVSTDSRGQDRDDHYSYWWAELGESHPDIRDAYTDLGWTEVLWDGPPSNKLSWSRLTETQQEAAAELDYTPLTWNHELSWEHLPPDIQTAYIELGCNGGNWGNGCFNDLTDMTPWEDLTTQQRDAAEDIGYDSTSWDQTYEHGIYDIPDDYDYYYDGDEGDEEDGEPINEGELSMPSEAVTPVEDYTYDGLGEAVTPVEDYTYDGLGEAVTPVEDYTYNGLAELAIA